MSLSAIINFREEKDNETENFKSIIIINNPLDLKLYILLSNKKY